jgi:pimeloyl-ACP methyl ester carboxylesterase
LDRRGFGENSSADGEDFEVDARDIAEALGEGAHLVAHSYGGVVRCWPPRRTRKPSTL